MFQFIVIALGLVVGIGLTLFFRGEQVAGAIMVTGGALGLMVHFSVLVMVNALVRCADAIARAMHDRKQVVVQIDNGRESPLH